ncbi:MAG: MBL fold metallo-hydrolase [Thermoprotei archaeon]|nr:MAG: MBL fold metallo-hydrolase [Thermoprotei archaeon]
MPVLRVLGGGREVGRSAYLLIEKERGILLDYGVNFEEEDHPQFPLHVRPIDLAGVVISHAHLDHIGAAPILYITGRQPIYVTRPTLDIAKLLINDFLKISGFYIDYDIAEFENLVSHAVLVEYGNEYEVEGYVILASSAGHILGSMLTYIDTPSGHRILYTGDVNTINTWTLSSAELWPKKIDTLIIESTYGSRKHPPRYLVEKNLVNSVEEVISSGGTVLIPAFSVARSQEIISLIQTELPHVEVYIDGMSRDITEIYMRHRKLLRDPSLFEKVVENTYFVRGWSDRRKIWRKPCVIVASAGMLKGGPSLYYLKKLGGSSRNAIYLVSYQAPNTPGHKLLEGGKLEELGISELKARLQWFDLSSHAGKDGLLSIVNRYKSSLRNVVIVHGEEDSAVELASMVKNLIDEDINVYIPSNSDEIVLE